MCGKIFFLCDISVYCFLVGFISQRSSWGLHPQNSMFRLILGVTSCGSLVVLAVTALAPVDLE